MHKTFTQIVLLPVLTLIRFLITIAILIIIIAMFSPYIKDVHKYKYIHEALVAENTVNKVVKQHVPTEIAGKDFSRLIQIIILLVLMELLDCL